MIQQARFDIAAGGVLRHLVLLTVGIENLDFTPDSAVQKVFPEIQLVGAHIINDGFATRILDNDFQHKTLTLFPDLCLVPLIQTKRDLRFSTTPTAT
jgi:hypothetical protein